MKSKCTMPAFGCRKQHCCKYCEKQNNCPIVCKLVQQSCNRRQCYDDNGYPLDDETYEIMRKEMEAQNGRQ